MLDTCIRVNSPADIDAPRVAMLSGLVTAAGKTGVPTLLVGAFVRDIWFEHVHGIRAPRATMDVDIAVLVRDWRQYMELREQLVASAAWLAEDGRV